MCAGIENWQLCPWSRWDSAKDTDYWGWVGVEFSSYVYLHCSVQGHFMNLGILKAK
jgi:hypothetical protein